MALENARVCETIRVGKINLPDATKIKIIHISDTHMLHNLLKTSLPDGDILIHSGDFGQWSLRKQFGNKTRDRREVVEEINRFFASLPYKHKIFVPGNHEGCLTNTDRDKLENILTSVTYLQDKMTSVEGLNIYGSPWTKKRWYSLADGFTKSGRRLAPIWDMIPEETDILVTHMPPFGILDLATDKFSGIKNIFRSSEGICNVCGRCHPQFVHWGCEHLCQTVLQKVK